MKIQGAGVEREEVEGEGSSWEGRSASVVMGQVARQQLQLEMNPCL